MNEDRDFCRLTYETVDGGTRTLWEKTYELNDEYDLGKLPWILFCLLRHMDESLNAVEMDEFEVLARVAEAIPITAGKERWAAWADMAAALVKSGPERKEAEFGIKKRPVAEP